MRLCGKRREKSGGYLSIFINKKNYSSFVYTLHLIILIPNGRLKLKFIVKLYITPAERYWSPGVIKHLVQVKVSNYWEAIGVIAAHKAGIDPYSLRRNRINNIKCITTSPPNGHVVSSASQQFNWGISLVTHYWAWF